MAAGVLAHGLAALIGIVALGGDDGNNPEPADSSCVESWNGDRQATSFGRHQ